MSRVFILAPRDCTCCGEFIRQAQSEDEMSAPGSTRGIDTIWALVGTQRDRSVFQLLVHVFRCRQKVNLQ